MMALVFLLLVLMLYASRRHKGPLWALGIAWLLSLAPIAAQSFNYAYLSPWDVGFALALVGFLGSFVVGVVSHDHLGKKSRAPSRRSPVEELKRAYPWARIAWWAGAVGTLCLCIDFALLQGAGLNDLAALRESYIAKEASVFARLASVLTWGCLYCFAFALSFSGVLSRWKFALFMLPIGGYFLVALFSAGRQATFQILIFTALTLALKRARRGSRPVARRAHTGIVLPAAIMLGMIVYMGYIAGARNDALVTEDKTEVLAHYFDYEIAPWLDKTLIGLGTGIRTTVVEASVYFSSSVALFSTFLKQDLPSHSYGAMSLPFIFRQLEPLTGISVIGALNDKIDMMQNAGVIGVGWTTAISSYILDFGLIGAVLVLWLQGYYSAFSWRRARLGTDFHEGLIAIILLTAAIYLPLIPASAETNLLLMWLFSMGALRWRRTRRLARPSPGPAVISTPAG